MGALLSSNKPPCCDEQHEGSSHVHRVPKHLKPTKPSKKQQRRFQQKEDESIRRQQKSSPRQRASHSPKLADSLTKNNAQRGSRINRIFGRATHHTNGTTKLHNTLLGDEMDDGEHGFSTVESLAEFARGGAYRWLQGRRFHNVKVQWYI